MTKTWQMGGKTTLLTQALIGHPSGLAAGEVKIPFS
jgi:hypothetical protein